ncbi:MAG: hypothetical protein LQ351_002123 [Letrouitia transgressa]|nr:MAG: hypothetical protein LQ351_002123 [Letrouitia transgressa]
MAAARPFEESWAWAQSASQRHAGGLYFSSFLNELLKEPQATLSDLLEKATLEEARTYNQHREDVLREANRLCIPDKIYMGSLPLFTTEGDDDKAFRRTGIALHYYQANFDRLKRVPASDKHPFVDKKRDVQPGDPEVKAWEVRHPQGDHTLAGRTGYYGSTRRGMRSSVIYLARIYTRSLPGAREQPSNTHLHKEIDRFYGGLLAGDTERIERLRSQLLYRIWMLRRANNYARWLNLNKVPRIEELDILRGLDKNIYEKAQDLFPIMHEYRLFAKPDFSGEYYGKFFMKPAQYLAYAFAASGYGPADVHRLIKTMLEQNVREVSVRRANILANTGSRRTKHSIDRMTDVVDALRSPRKRQRASLASTGWMSEA